MIRKLAAEAIGTCLLVFFGVGVATLTFGFFSGSFASGQATIAIAAGTLATALAFGLSLLVIAYVIGPISGGHVNPAVTLGMLLARRITLSGAVSYWIGQFAGGIVGALLLWALLAQSPLYHRARQGLGANGWGADSSVDIGLGGAFLTEVILTAAFVFVVLMVTRAARSPATAGLAIGLSLTVVHLIGIPIDGTSVNPARSLGPAVILGGIALSQVWLFIVAPLVGAVVAAVLHRLIGDDPPAAAAGVTNEGTPAAAGAQSQPGVPAPRGQPQAGAPGAVRGTRGSPRPRRN